MMAKRSFFRFDAVMRCALLLTWLSLSACSGHKFVVIGQSGSVLFRDVRVFDSEHARFGAPSCVKIDGPKIDAVMAEPCTLTADRVQSGGYLVPGLSDLHAHVTASPAPPDMKKLPDLNENLTGFLYAGVTTVFDVASAFDVVDARNEVAAGKRLGPRIYATGPLVTTRGGHPQAAVDSVAPWPLSWFLIRRMTRVAETRREADDVIHELHEHQVDAVKLAVDHLPLPSTPVLDANAVSTIIQAAHHKGLRVVAHIGSSEDAAKVVAGGVDALVHGVYLDRATDEVIAELAAKKIPVACTLSVFHNLERMLTHGAASALEVEMGEKTILAGLSLEQPESDLKTWVRAVQTGRPFRVENCKRMWAAGVPMLVGSDSPNVGHFAGAGTHLELAELAAMGMPNAEVLRAATATNARFLKGDFGVIAAGRSADVIWVDRDPVVDLAALTQPRAVIAAGQWLERHSR